MPNNRNFPFRIGADPELNLLIDDRHFCASNLLTDMFNNELKSRIQEGTTIGFDMPEAGNIGWDGNSDIAELRPLPANNPKEVTNNFKKLIEKILKINPLLEMSTLCDTGTIGGHIHFELPANIKEKLEYDGNTSPLASLSRKLATFYLPLLLNEDKLNLKTRNLSDYGNMTDYRYERRGSVFTFEYRAPSAEWLTTKEICQATLAYMATVYNEIINQPANFAKCNGFMFKNSSQADASKELAIDNFNAFLGNLNSKIKKTIRQFEFYPQYKEEIEFIMNAKKVSKIKQKAGYNVGIGWNIVKYKQPSKRLLFSRMKKDDNQLNLDEISKLIPTFYNPDTNVDKFVNDLKLKIARFNWRTKNHYFLFGLKKGIKDFIIANKNTEFMHGQNQLETSYDAKCIKDAFYRMNQKFPYIKKRQLLTAEEDNRHYILIGIPYKLRLSLNSKPLIEFIHRIEKGELTANKLPTNLPATSSDKDGNPHGKIYAIYNNIREERSAESEERRIESAKIRLDEAVGQLITNEEEMEDCPADATPQEVAQLINQRVDEIVNPYESNSF